MRRLLWALVNVLFMRLRELWSRQLGQGLQYRSMMSKAEYYQPDDPRQQS